MKLERSNILELIGSGKSKYHSCVITSYSIDLAFFEQLILPRLRGAGITNINILVDAAMLEKYLATHLGNSTSNFKAKYSITPVHISGAFHPKMLFLAGKERSYLAVGSGNITSSGLLYNDEIWSSFYMSKDKKSAQPIFKSAWAYIQNLSTFCSGINQTKIKWIPQHSKWIEALADNQEEKANIKETAYKLYYTKQDISLYKELISELLPKPKSIKIIAPYYNRSGAFLQNLVDDLNPLEMHCIVEKANGILPSDFQSSLCQFSDWSDVIKPVNSSGVQKLHAKIIQIEYKTHTVLIIGSANATLEAFGISNRNFKNEEAIIRIQSPNSRDFLKELGISIPKEGTLDIQKTESTEQNNQETLLGLLKIKHAELSQQTLRITLLEPITKSVLIKIFSSNNELLESIELSASSSIIETALVAVENTFKVAFYDIKTLQRISSFGLIQNADVLKRSNPDERLARIQSFESLDIFNSLDYELVLNFLSEEHIFKESNSSQTTALENTTPSSDMGQVISEKEYNRNAGQSLDEKITNENITSLVEDFLDVLKIRENDEELSSNIEELALAASDDGLDNDSTLNNSQKIIAAKEGKRIARKIIKTIKAVNNLINNRTSTDIPQNIRTLNALFIGFHILLHFWDEVYTEELSVVKIRYKNLTALSRLEKKFGLIRLNTQAGCSKQEVLYQISYIDINSLQHFVINSNNEFTIVGKFSNPTATDYKFIADKHVTSYHDSHIVFEFIDLSISTILSSVHTKKLHLNGTQKLKLCALTSKLINVVGWNKKMTSWRDLILLNSYECLFDISLLERNNVDSELISNSVFKKYSEFKMKLIQNNVSIEPLSHALTGNIIYSNNLGFGKIKRLLKNDCFEFYSPMHADNFKEDELGLYKDVYIGKKVKVLKY